MNNGFTLIELLVVITIIVVLLALLTPALDKAIYQAELAVCASRLHAIGTGAISYTFRYRRYYPYRPHLRGQEASERYIIYDTEFDDRPALSEFVSLNNHLNDPLVGDVDVEGPEHDESLLQIP